MPFLLSLLLLLPVHFSQIRVQGELQQRLQQNFNRLEEEKYQPQHVFLTMQQSSDWPGDTEGRTILALTLDAQATGRTPLFLDEIIGRLPQHLNEKGYMGPVFTDFMHEQQLSGNGWMLRGLCEYYLWKPSPVVLEHIRHISHHLFLPHKGRYAAYPIHPEDRPQDTGAESGSSVSLRNGWQLSSDIGCVFIGMDGLIQAYGILHDEQLRPIVEEMIDRFLQIDLTGIRAQTHATLTALRGLVRYAELSGRRDLIAEAEKRFQLYVENGMTENFENYNWFRRFDTWTEPCAIVDSYLLAVQLWQHTHQPHYLQWAELIYYNALCRTQRHNGGFGLDNCPGLAAHNSSLCVHAPEAHWCCTMRGGEGLARAAQYSLMQEGNHLWTTTLRPWQATVTTKRGERVKLEMESDYPWQGNCTLRIVEASGKTPLTLSLPLHPWMEHPALLLNGQPVATKKEKGFISLRRRLHSGDQLTYTFSQSLRWERALNPGNTAPEARRALWGPLMLQLQDTTRLKALPANCRLERIDGHTFRLQGTPHRLEPVYHLMSPAVWQKEHTGHQILFSLSN